MACQEGRREMSATTVTQTAQPLALVGGACYPPFRMSVDHYEKLVDSGVFTKRDKLQLINGILVAKVTQNPPHSVADLRCGKAFAQIASVSVFGTSLASGVIRRQDKLANFAFVGRIHASADQRPTPPQLCGRPAVV
jgi:hypothetical protein